MIFDITYHSLSQYRAFRCRDRAIGCKEAPFPKRDFKMDIRGEVFEGSIRVQVEPKVHAPLRGDLYCPMIVGAGVFKDSYGEYILDELRLLKVIKQSASHFYFKVVA